MDSSPPDHPIRVALDAGPLYGLRTGVGVATAGLTDALADRSDVTVHPYLVSFRAKPYDGHVRLPLPGIVASHLWSRSGLMRADRWLEGADLVHGTNYVAPPTRLPTVISVYDCWFLANPEHADGVVRRAGANLRRAASRGAWIHVGADAVNEQARELLGTNRVRTIALGPPPPIAPPASLQVPDVAAPFVGRPFIVSIGTEDRRKDLPLLLQAFRTIAEGLPDTALVLAGARSNGSDAVDAAMADLPPSIAARVHRLGRVEEPTKHWLLRQAAALAYLSLDEGFGFPILEAHEAGTPVVASAVGSIPEVASDAALLVTERTAAAIGHALQRCLTDGGLRLTLIGAGYTNRSRFSWASTAGHMVDLYRDALADRE